MRHVPQRPFLRLGDAHDPMLTYFCTLCRRMGAERDAFPSAVPRLRTESSGLGVLTNATVLEPGITDEYDVWDELEMTSVALYCQKGDHRKRFFGLIERRSSWNLQVRQCLVRTVSDDLKAPRVRLQEERTPHEQCHAHHWVPVFITVSTIADLQRVTRKLANDDDTYISAQTDDLAIVVPNFREALGRTIRVSADAAMTSVLRPGNSCSSPQDAHRRRPTPRA
ncbi:hypothetical protein EDB83DRAFT_1934537 [Lactarius deliciosus]|nr:hypothetical protein EDB83DRAFT_1934537 [Lactarius deliciosus]